MLMTPDERAALKANGYLLRSIMPQACAGQPHRKTVAEVEAEWAACKKTKADAGHKQPAAACLAEQQGEAIAPDIARRLAALDAATKRLEAINAQSKADAAKRAAKQAAASLTPHLDRFMSLAGAEATNYYRQHEGAIRTEQFTH